MQCWRREGWPALTPTYQPPLSPGNNRAELGICDNYRDIYTMMEKGGMASIDSDISAAFVTR